MFRNTFLMRDNMNNTPKTRGPGVWCTTSALVCTCTHGVQEKGAICLVILQTAEILGLICFAIHFLCVTIE